MCNFRCISVKSRRVSLHGNNFTIDGENIKWQNYFTDYKDFEDPSEIEPKINNPSEILRAMKTEI